MPEQSKSTPPATVTSDELFMLEALKDSPDIWSGWQKDGTIRQENDSSLESVKHSSNISPVQAWFSDPTFRKQIKNPAFIKSIQRFISNMKRASQAPLRRIVIHYRADEPLYPFEEVMMHFINTSAHSRVFCALLPTWQDSP